MPEYKALSVVESLRISVANRKWNVLMNCFAGNFGEALLIGFRALTPERRTPEIR
jgi:hypothetical protein